jgi:hypothetical protein
MFDPRIHPIARPPFALIADRRKAEGLALTPRLIRFQFLTEYRHCLAVKFELLFAPKGRGDDAHQPHGHPMRTVVFVSFHGTL